MGKVKTWYNKHKKGVLTTLIIGGVVAAGATLYSIFGGKKNKNDVSYELPQDTDTTENSVEEV